MSGNLAINILDKIATLAESNVQINAQILTATKKTNEILSKEIHSELKKQTGILTRLVDAIASKSEKTGDNVKFNLFGGNTKIDGSFLKQLEKTKISEKSLRTFASGINAVAASIERFADAIDRIDENKLEVTLKFFSSVTKAIALFAVTVLLAAPALLIGTMVALPLILLWGAAFNLIGKYNKNIEKGAKGLKTMGIAVGLLGLAVAGYIFFNGGIQGAIVNSAVVALSVFIMALPMLFIAKHGKDLAKAAVGMLIMSLSVFLLGMAIKSYYEALGGDAKDPMSMLIATATVAGSLLLIGGAFALIGKMTSQIIQGAVGMLIAGVSVIVLAKAVEMWMNAAPTWESLAMLGVAVLGLGVAMAAAGAVSSLIIPGALAILIASVAIIPLAKGVEMWVKAKPTWEDLATLGAAIVGLGVAMAGWGLGAIFIIPGAAAMLIASTGIYAFTAGLVNYKKAKWRESDTDSMMHTLDTILSGFIDIFTDISFADIAKAMMGTALLGGLGNSLSQFAQGVAAMANLQVPTYEVKDGKLVLVGTKPLDSDFAKKVATNIDTMVSALIEPLAKLGANEGLFFDGPVGNGIDLLGRLGNSLSQFALGVQGMANLQVPIYEVKNGKLVLKGTKPLDPDFAKKVGVNIQMIVDSLMEPIKKLGAESGWFFDSDFEDGLDMLGQLGEPIADLAEGITAFSKLEAGSFNGKTIADNIASLAKGLHAAFTKKSGYDATQGASLRYFADTLSILSNSINIDTTGANNTEKAFASITKSVNSLDLKRLSKLNRLMINFNKLAQTLKESFDDVDEVLEKLLQVVQQLNEAESISANAINTKSNTNTGNAAQIQMPDSIKISNIDELMGSLDDIKNVLLGTLDVRVDDNLLR
jgi:hypothetical protein